MLFYSTNKKSPKVDFEKAFITGLAPDGGLYFPTIFPKFSQKEIKDLIGKTLADVGYAVLKKWLNQKIDDESLRKITNKALDFPIPLKKIGDYYILELFHGPTFAFKDVAAKILARIMDYFLGKRDKQIMILTATSGDTGGAVAQGFSGLKNVKVVVLYPKGKVSKLQEEQLTRVKNNIIPVEIDGVFDDCQALVKKAFVDHELGRLCLTSANSINIGRLIPQTIYYIYTYTCLAQDNIQFIVPSGNMGNITAGLFAHQMNLPFNSYIIATNANDSVVKYYQTGKFKPQRTISTLSNAMDIGNPSNFVRILELFNNDHQAFNKIIQAIKINEEETVSTIKKVYEKYGYLLDPHTSVAFRACEKIGDPDATRVIVSTASPLKFAYEIQKATGIKVNNQEIIKKLQKRKKKKYNMENNYNKLKKILIDLK